MVFFIPCVPHHKVHLWKCHVSYYKKEVLLPRLALILVSLCFCEHYSRCRLLHSNCLVLLLDLTSCVMVSPHWGEQCPLPWPLFLCPTLVSTFWTPSASSLMMLTLKSPTTPSLPWAWWAVVSRTSVNSWDHSGNPVQLVFYFILCFAFHLIYIETL